MSESPEARSRRRWISFGEIVAVAALIVSAVGVWVSWQGSGKPAEGPTRIVEQKQPIPLILRGHAEDGGRRMELKPVEAGHSLESARITLPGGTTADVGSDGELFARDVEGALRKQDKALKGDHSATVKIEARYVEMGAERTSSRTYRLRYRWDGGGLFGGHNVRLTDLSRG